MLLVVLFQSVDWSSLSHLILNLRWSNASLSTTLFLVFHGLNVLRWRWITAQPDISIWAFVKYYGAGQFSNNFLPTGFGGDAVRAALLSTRVSLPRATLSVTLDRGIGLLSLGVLCLLGIWLGWPPGLFHGVPAGILDASFFLVIAILFVGGAAAVFLWSRKPAFRGITEGLGRCFELVHMKEGNALSWRWLFGRFAGAYCCSVLSNLSLVLAFWSAIGALGIVVAPGAAVWLVCAVFLSLLAPLTVNGLGLQEGVFVVVLGCYSVPIEAALGIALFVRLLTLAFSALGGLLALWGTARLPTVSRAR